MRPTHSRSTAVAAWVLAAAAFPAAARAQGAAAPATAPPCAYDACALRVEPRFFGAPRVLRGSVGRPVATLGWFGSGLAEAVQGSDSAVRHARDYRRARLQGVVGAAAGVTLFFAGAALCRSDDDSLFGCTGRANGLMLSGIAVNAVAAAVTQWRSQRALARSVWWYNRGLAR